MEGPAAPQPPRTFTYCPHGLVKELVLCRRCVDEGTDGACQVIKVEAHRFWEKAKTLKLSHLPCPHRKEKRFCKVCGGSSVCAHGKNKVYCKECDGRRVCQVCFLRYTSVSYGVCKRCKKHRAVESQERLDEKKAKQNLALRI